MVPRVDHVAGDLPSVVEADRVAVPDDTLLAVAPAGAEALVPVADPVGEVPREYEAEPLLLAGVDLLGCADAGDVGFALLAGLRVAVWGEAPVLQVVPVLSKGVPPAAAEPLGLCCGALVGGCEGEAAVEDVVVWVFP